MEKSKRNTIILVVFGWAVIIGALLDKSANNSPQPESQPQTQAKEDKMYHPPPDDPPVRPNSALTEPPPIAPHNWWPPDFSREKDPQQAFEDYCARVQMFDLERIAAGGRGTTAEGWIEMATDRYVEQVKHEDTPYSLCVKGNTTACEMAAESMVPSDPRYDFVVLAARNAKRF